MKRIAYHAWVWVLCIAVCACAAGFLIGRLSAGGAARVRTGHPANTAAKEELMLLPRIGETLAERILAYRAENGKFISTEQLMDIDGIGEGTYNSIRDLVTVEDNP